jgi:hypothetical protein
LQRVRNRGPQIIRAGTLALLGITAFASIVMDGASSANAKSHRRSERHRQSTPIETPRLAVIALAQQHISIYGASGKILEAPVSTGVKGRDTPAGIYSIVQKEEDHHSNLYDDASMPFMERLTWTGIAMHAGPVPGYPASHGCTRLPYGFAQQLYQLTEPGMRVVIVREDIAPVKIEQPAMFTLMRPSGPAALPSAGNSSAQLSEGDIRARLKSVAAAKAAEAQAAIKLESAARTAAAKRAAEAAPALRLLEAAKVNFAKAESDMTAAEQTPESVDLAGGQEKSNAVKAQAVARMESARAQLETAKTQAQAKMDAASQAGKEADAAAAAMNQAAETAEIAKQDASPVSVFISRKMRRFYIRKGNYPVAEGPVTIRNPEKPLGTFIFTALNYAGTPGRLRWNVVSMYKNATNIEPYSDGKRSSKKHRGAEPADVTGAQSALARISIAQDELGRIGDVLLPGSSLIISDEGPSSETGKDTDFIVFMSGEPQGGAKPPSPSAIARSTSVSSPREARRQRRRMRSASSEGARWPSQRSNPIHSPFDF